MAWRFDGRHASFAFVLALCGFSACSSRSSGSDAVDDTLTADAQAGDIEPGVDAPDVLGESDVDALAPDGAESCPEAGCDDGNACTADTCDGGTCRFTPTAGGAACDDDDPCTTGDSCDSAGVCQGLLLDCPLGTPCSPNTCEPLTGACVPMATPDGTACDDGDACSGGSTCESGTCVGFGISQCEDGNPCTVDSCEPATGECVSYYAPDAIVCDDNDPCTVLDACAAGTCVGSPKECADPDFCHTATCEQASGDCVAVPLDDDPCIDDDACTVDYCDEDEGCVHVPVSGGCDDRNECTDDHCDKELGCQHIPSATVSCTAGCCASHDSPGCTNLDCAACVCQADSACCNEGWDPLCVETAHEACAAACECTCGDGLCSETESCVTCLADCGGCPVIGDAGPGCCEANDSGGCPPDDDCETCVCGIESTCCSDEWSELCASLASSAFCGETCGSCACGDGLCEGFESCSECPADCGSCAASDCCAGSVCDEPTCQVCACALDPACCSDWPEQCSDLASSGACAGSCGCTCGDGACDAVLDSCATCPTDCGPCTGSCCEASSSPGCAEEDCSSCVCEFAPDCCSSAWSDECVGLAEFVCPLECGCPSP
ncbi:MAG: hypothetical protein IV100_00260 [Myxococcales bacterium]|nr:hypothetical protein [Myxococcales bacterium]